MVICSLLPSATEILYALDLGDSVAGVTFECDYPAVARAKAIVVDTVLPHDLSPAQIDEEVTQLAGHGDGIYTIDAGLLETISPDLIVTQELCDVCAVSTSQLARALHTLTSAPVVLSLTPHTLDDVLTDIESVGRAAGCESKARELVASLRERLNDIRARPKRQNPKVACLEWLAPPFNAGHWVPEMMAIAGGVDHLGAYGQDSVRIDWEQVRSLAPDVILIMPCGYNAAHAAEEYRKTEFPSWWSSVPAVRNKRVYAVNATAYFSRPGPRLIDGVEIAYALLQGDTTAALPADGWLQL